MKTKFYSWFLRIVPAVILLQTLYFKFTADPDAVHIFTALGAEPYGRIGLGVFELLTAFLLLYPRTATTGASLGVLLMIGAILSHIFVLGVEVRNDGGLLFILAVITLVCCALFLLFRKSLIPKNV